jgi:RNA polymerase primary sigma factor
MQESFFGLRIAVERYNADQGVPFVNYAAIWIEQTISAYIETCGHVVRFPRWMNSRIIKYEKARKKFYQENEREPSDQELADILNLTLKQLKKVKTNALVMDINSLDKVISAEDDDLSLVDAIPDPIDHYEEITDQMDEDIKRQAVWSEVDRLKENESEVIKEYYLKGRTLDDIGQIRGCSQENVRQIKNKALSKLRRSDKLKRYADDYLSARAYTGTGINSFKRTGTSATERTAIEHIDKVIQSHVRETDRQIRRIEKKYGFTLNQFRKDMTDKILKDMNA